ncbi:MAG: magnesium chelatase domain-containing protein [Actinomycetota bacterium]
MSAAPDRVRVSSPETESRGNVAVRVWGAVGDRLVEVLTEAAEADSGLRIVGLPAGRARTAADRVRAAIVNSRLLPEAALVEIRLEPPLDSGESAPLDLPMALGALVSTGVIGEGLGWIFATGRLGLDGSVHLGDVDEPRTLREVVSSCQTPLLGYEHQFEGEM